MPKTLQQTIKKNLLTKLQNLIRTPAIVKEIKIFMEILMPNLEFVKDGGIKLIALVIKEAKLLIIHQLVEQTIPNSSTKAITTRTPALIIIK